MRTFRYPQEGEEKRGSPPDLGRKIKFTPIDFCRATNISKTNTTVHPQDVDSKISSPTKLPTAALDI